MYHSILRILLVSSDHTLAGVLQSQPPLERFEHTFQVRTAPFTDTGALPAKVADIVILDCPANLPVPGADAARTAFGPDAILILRLDPTHPTLPDLDWTAWNDVWIAVPGRTDPDVLRFRLLRESIKADRDRLLAQTYLDTLIDSVPDLIWFKDVRGAHLKVNNAFCDAVGKTKSQCEGRGHYYIWDLKKEEYEKGEYVCLETEETVLRERKTCLFDEKVKSRQGLRQFKTYKSPLFDERGEVMGTVGIARDVTDLRNMDAEMEILLRSMPFGILVRDMDGRILKVNEKFREYFRAKDQDLVGRDYDRWKNAALGAAPCRTADGNLELKLNFDGETFLYELHEEPIHDVFHTVVGRLCIVRDITIERTFEQKILLSANTDALTGLYNRRYFYEYVGSHRGEERISLLYVDLDNFKQINDAYGHQVGDTALVAVGRLLRASFPEAVIARVGGDEFLVTRTNPCDVSILEEQSKAFLRALHRHCEASDELRALSASIGITCARDAAINIDDLIRQSDTALYAAKRRGKSRFVVYTPELEADLEREGRSWMSKFRFRTGRSRRESDATFPSGDASL